MPETNQNEGSVSNAGHSRRRVYQFGFAVAVLAIVLLLVHSHDVAQSRKRLDAFLHSDSGDASFVIHNTTTKSLERVVLVSDRGVLEIGTVAPGQTLIDPRPSTLGEIDYHLVNTLDGKRMASRHFYRGNRPLNVRLYHRFEQAVDGQFRWVEYTSGTLYGRDIEAQTDLSKMPCCRAMLPASELTHQ